MTYEINQTVYFSAKPVTFIGEATGRAGKKLALLRAADGREFKADFRMIDAQMQFEEPKLGVDADLAAYLTSKNYNRFDL